MHKKMFLITQVSMLGMSAVLAETTFYGRAQLGLWTQDGDWEVNDSGSRWGVKGSGDLGDGLGVVYQFETAIAGNAYADNPEGQIGRLAWVGLQSGLGTASLGAQ